jgi:hypothetical protein
MTTATATMSHVLTITTNNHTITFHLLIADRLRHYHQQFQRCLWI